MTELQGTEKQIAWAEQIRGRLLSQIEERVAALRTQNPELIDISPVILRLADDTEAAYNTLAAPTDARWWIDRRQYSARDLVREIMDAAAPQTREEYLARRQSSRS